MKWLVFETKNIVFVTKSYTMNIYKKIMLKTCEKHDNRDKKYSKKAY